MILYLTPWLERRLTGDYGFHNLLDRPRDAPWRTALGVALFTWVFLIFFAGAGDRIFVLFGLSYELQIWIFRVLVVVAPAVALVVIAALLSVAATQPTLVRRSQQHVRTDAEAWFVLDTSLSMKAQDVPPTRLEAARRGASAFVDRVPEKFRIGIVGFTGRPYVALPPTDDRTLVAPALNSLRPGEGTSLGDALALALQLGRKQRAADGSTPPTAILLISDGAQLSGRTTPQSAARKARAQHVPIYTVVVGTPNGTIDVTLTGGFHAQLRVPPRPDTLQMLAHTTGGQFFTARNDARLREIYTRLGSRLGTRNESREISDYFAGGSAALLLFGGALSALWFRRVP
jgi:Ca-activated chloride channel family protein